jgi:hypothetical protein
MWFWLALLLLVSLQSVQAPVSADYGSGAQFQVETSANSPQNGFWLWAELGPNQTSDYEETDYIHLGLGPDGALHDSGSLSSWSVTSDQVTMNGMLVLGGLETATVSAPTCDVKTATRRIGPGRASGEQSNWRLALQRT